MIERIVPNIGNAVGDGNVGQTAALKRIVSDGSDAGRDGNASHVGVIPEGRISYCCDRKTIDSVWNSHRTTRTRVARDGDGSIIGNVSKLSLRGHRQQQQHHVNPGPQERPAEIGLDDNGLAAIRSSGHITNAAQWSRFHGLFSPNCWIVTRPRAEFNHLMFGT